MPRHNRPTRGQVRRPTVSFERVPSYEDMARALVKAGKCTPDILEKPWTPGADR